MWFTRERKSEIAFTILILIMSQACLLGYTKMIALQGSMPNICSVSSGMPNIYPATTAHLGSFPSLCATPCSRLRFLSSRHLYICFFLYTHISDIFNKLCYINLCEPTANWRITSRSTRETSATIRTSVICNNRSRYSQRSEKCTRVTERTARHPCRWAQRENAALWTEGGADCAAEWTAIREPCLRAIWSATREINCTIIVRCSNFTAAATYAWIIIIVKPRYIYCVREPFQ